MKNSLGKWEKYIHLESEEILIQLAVVHAQFEIIHPFLDGNGRIGRILVPLFLYAKKYSEFPAFYMSEYLESYRSEYYTRLNNISTIGDWQGWIEFFLRAIIEQSQISKNRVDRILKLYDKTRQQMVSITNSKYAMQIIDILFEKPIFTATDICQKIDEINRATVIRFLNELSDINILKKEEGKGSRASSYEFVELLEIVEGRVLFIIEFVCI